MAIRMIVIDDNETLAAFTARNIQRRMDGLEVLTASTCDEARRIAQNYPPSIIVVDERLPDGSGLELIKELSENNGSLIPILISGELPPENLRKGVFDAIEKPYEVETLIKAVDKALNLNSFSTKYSNVPESKPSNNLVSKPHDTDRHKLLNLLSALSIGLKAFDIVIRDNIDNKDAINLALDNYINELHGHVKDITKIIKKKSTL